MQLSFSMEREPPHPASFAAKGRPFVLRLCDSDSCTAIPARKGPLHRAGRNAMRTPGMLPIQPFAVSRAEFCPPVCRLRHPYQLAAFQAAEGAQGLLFPRRPAVVIDAVTVSVAPAIIAAVFLRDPVRFEFFAANGACFLPLHRLVMDSLASPRNARREHFRARKKDSMSLRQCCLLHIVSPEYTNPPKDCAKKEHTCVPNAAACMPAHE